MSSQKRLVEVKPVNRVEKDSSVYEYPYGFSECHPGEFLEVSDEVIKGDKIGVEEVGDEFGEGVVDGDALWWQYGDRVRVLVTENGCFVEEGSSIGSGEEQAYYALSVMASEGYVSNWGKE